MHAIEKVEVSAYKKPGVEPPVSWVSDGARTRDILDHNQVLYQLSYTHHHHFLSEAARPYFTSTLS